MNKKRCFIVMTLGYWGRGETLKQAALNCKKTMGGVPGARACAFLIEGDDKATVDGMGCICRDSGSENITIGAGFTLNHLLCLEN